MYMFIYILNRGAKCHEHSDSHSKSSASKKGPKSGHRRGPKHHKTTGNHLSTAVLNEAFADTCSEDGQTQLTVALWFMYTVSNINSHGMKIKVKNKLIEWEIVMISQRTCC